MQTNFEALRLFEAIAFRNVPEHLSKPKRVEFVKDADGRQVMYMNFTSATGQTDGDTAVFVRTVDVLPKEVLNSFVAMSNTPNHVVPPSPILEIWIQDGLMSSDLAIVKDEFLNFLRSKAARNAILRVVTGEHPTLKGVFGETADSAKVSRSYPVGAAPMMGGN